jgi:hypothetical protein
MLEIPRNNNTFEHSAATIFNSLPQEVRDNSFYRSYVKEVKTVLTERARTRILN